MSRPPLLIESPQNPRFRLWESLLESRGLKKHGQFLLSGLKTVPEALAAHPGRFTAVLTDAAERVAGWRLPPGMEVVQLAPALFRRLDVAGTGFPLLLGPVPAMAPVDLSRPPEGLELVVALSDPGNLGALLRSAAAFGAGRVVLLEESAHPFHPRCLRGAANAQFALTLLRGPRWPALNTAAGPLVALDAGGTDLTAFAWPRDLRLVLGEEGQGVPADLPALRLAVPTTGAVESLNATVAASLALFARFTAGRGQAESGRGEAAPSGPPP
ncbi:TrmH family RNA methyltransferase [Azospirillum halopraeferens]|uniref:TrmH family RNA methyltransferase n=1 Tax=Azospirillum halopraeferens TaxID=34010 RepID=UPI000412749C|nr:RNA methyltransferase [Azospirillum halopraeferens]